MRDSQGKRGQSWAYNQAAITRTPHYAHHPSTSRAQAHPAPQAPTAPAVTPSRIPPANTSTPACAPAPLAWRREAPLADPAVGPSRVHHVPCHTHHTHQHPHLVKVVT